MMDKFTQAYAKMISQISKAAGRKRGLVNEMSGDIDTGVPKNVEEALNNAGFLWDKFSGWDKPFDHDDLSLVIHAVEGDPVIISIEGITDRNDTGSYGQEGYFDLMDADDNGKFETVEEAIRKIGATPHDARYLGEDEGPDSNLTCTEDDINKAYDIIADMAKQL